MENIKGGINGVGSVYGSAQFGIAGFSPGCLKLCRAVNAIIDRFRLSDKVFKKRASLSFARLPAS